MPVATPRSNGLASRLALKLPHVLILYPFELVAALFAAIIAVAGATGHAIPPALAEFLHPSIIVLWTVALGLSSAGIAFGVTRRFREILPAGLGVFAVAVLAYIVAIVGYQGLKGLPAASMLGILVVVAALRALYTAATEDLRKSANGADLGGEHG